VHDPLARPHQARLSEMRAAIRSDEQNETDYKPHETIAGAVLAKLVATVSCVLSVAVQEHPKKIGIN